MAEEGSSIERCKPSLGLGQVLFSDLSTKAEAPARMITIASIVYSAAWTKQILDLKGRRAGFHRFIDDCIYPVRISLEMLVRLHVDFCPSLIRHMHTHMRKSCTQYIPRPRGPPRVHAWFAPSLLVFVRLARVKIPDYLFLSGSFSLSGLLGLLGWLGLLSLGWGACLACQICWGGWLLGESSGY